MNEGHRGVAFGMFGVRVTPAALTQGFQGA